MLKVKSLIVSCFVGTAVFATPSLAATLNFSGTITEVTVSDANVAGLVLPSVGDVANSVFTAFGNPNDLVSLSAPGPGEATGVATTFDVPGTDISSGFDIFVVDGGGGAFGVNTTRLTMSGLSFNPAPMMIAPNAEFQNADQFITYTFGTPQLLAPDNATELMDAIATPGTTLDYGYRGVILFDGGASFTQIRIEASMTLVEPIPLPASGLLLGSTVLAGFAWRRRAKHRA